MSILDGLGRLFSRKWGSAGRATMGDVSGQLVGVYRMLNDKGLAGDTALSQLSAGLQESLRLGGYRRGEVLTAKRELMVWQHLNKKFDRGQTVQDAAAIMGKWLNRNENMEGFDAQVVMNRYLTPAMPVDALLSNHRVTVQAAYNAKMLFDPAQIPVIAEAVGGEDKLRAILASLNIQDVKI